MLYLEGLGGVEFYYVEADEVVLVLVLDFFKPVDHRCRVFPLVEIGCSLARLTETAFNHQ